MAKNTGFRYVDIEKVYAHVFERQHLFRDGTIHKFHPDYDMAQSWQRLREGRNIQKHDIVLIKHELYEANIMGTSLNIVYEDVHEKTDKMYNYSKALADYKKAKG